eukprot:COSAG02_NODE_651_length_18910_cov_12.561639_2_plen_138_part_00
MVALVWYKLSLFYTCKIKLKNECANEHTNVCFWKCCRVQFGVMSPVFRTHCDAECSCQPWDYMVDETYSHAITTAFQLRDMLMPYIYTAAYEAYTSGITINHPVYYDFPEEDEAYNDKQSYLFGPSVLVAAIVSHTL